MRWLHHDISTAAEDEMTRKKDYKTVPDFTLTIVDCSPSCQCLHSVCLYLRRYLPSPLMTASCRGAYCSVHGLDQSSTSTSHFSPTQVFVSNRRSNGTGNSNRPRPLESSLQTNNVYFDEAPNAALMNFSISSSSSLGFSSACATASHDVSNMHTYK